MYTFQPMTPVYALDISRWHYPEPYGVYSYRTMPTDEVIAYMCDPAQRFYAVLEDGNLIAFRSYGPDGQVPGGDYDENHLDTGGGMRPDLTGQGKGLDVIGAGLDFATKQFGASRFRVTIAGFNQRAQKACQRLGFTTVQEFSRQSDGKPFVVMTLERKKEPNATL
jgi:RimJ/RimL family protein N-acetyltransferase